MRASRVSRREGKFAIVKPDAWKLVIGDKRELNEISTPTFRENIEMAGSNFDACLK